MHWDFLPVGDLDEEFSRLNLQPKNVSKNKSSSFGSHRRAVGDLHQEPQLPINLLSHFNLKVISQPKGTDLRNIATYAYLEEELGTARVYSIDSGVNPLNDVSIISSF